MLEEANGLSAKQAEEEARRIAEIAARAEAKAAERAKGTAS